MVTLPISAHSLRNSAFLASSAFGEAFSSDQNVGVGEGDGFPPAGIGVASPTLGYLLLFIFNAEDAKNAEFRKGTGTGN